MDYLVNIIITYLMTIVVSCQFKVVNFCRAIDDVLDAGYKFNLGNISKKNNQKGNADIKLFSRSLLIPFYNIHQVLRLIFSYDGEILLEDFKRAGIIEKMDDFERKLYKKKPSVATAITISKGSYKKETLVVESKNMDEVLSEICSVKIGNGEIFYSKDELSDEITILRVTGELSELSEKEQHRIVRDTCNKIANGYKKQKEALNLICPNGDTFSSDLSNQEKIIVLETFKKYLNENYTCEQENDKPYSRRKR